MNRSFFVIVLLACTVSLSCLNVSFSDELAPIEFINQQDNGTRPVVVASDERRAIRSFSADLEVTKVCEPEELIKVGQQSSCNIVVRNLGPDPAFKVTITDKLTSTETFTIGNVTISEGSCTVTFTHLHKCSTVICVASNIAPNKTITIMVPISVKTPQDIDDFATVIGQPFDPISENNSASGSVQVITHSH